MEDNTVIGFSRLDVVDPDKTTVLDQIIYDEVCALEHNTQQVIKAGEGSDFPHEADFLNKLLNEWSKKGRASIEEVLQILKDDLGLDEQTAREVMYTFDKHLKTNFTASVETSTKQLLDRSYQDARLRVSIPASLPLGLDLIDETTIEWLQNHHLYWIKSYYNKKLSGHISDIVTEGLREGLGRKDVGNNLKEFFKNYKGVSSKPDVYWRGLAANAMNRSRQFGMIEGYERAGVKRLRIMAVMDERTSAICREMNGRIIPIDQAVRQKKNIIGASDPEDIKQMAPWPKIDEIKGLETEQIMAKNVVLPPYHFHCRTTVVSVT